MKRYQAILFDADETLLDFSKSERIAFQKTMEYFNILYSEEMLYLYSISNKECWLMLEKQEITKQQLMILRFEKFIQRSGICASPADLNVQYKKMLAQCGFLLPNADKIIDFAKKHFKIYIVTNGIAEIQKSRLSICNIYSRFDDVFISEEIGAPKPQREFFDYVFNKIQAPLSQTILIGDSITADISGELRMESILAL